MNPVYTWHWDSTFPWNTEIVLMVGDNKSRMREILEDRYSMVYTASFLGINGCHEQFSRHTDDAYVVMLFCEWANTSQQVAMLVHEVSHMVFSICKTNKYPLPKEEGVNDEELFNDFLQKWTQHFLDSLNDPDKDKNIFLFDDEKEHLAKKQHERASQPAGPEFDQSTRSPLSLRLQGYPDGPLPNPVSLSDRGAGASTRLEETASSRTKQSEESGSGHRGSDSDVAVLAAP